MPENRLSDTIFKRIGLQEDLFSYSKSVFREDLFLYNSSRGRWRATRRGGGGGFDAAALVLAVALLVALVVVADAEVQRHLVVVVLQAALGVDLVLEGPYGYERPGVRVVSDRFPF